MQIKAAIKYHLTFITKNSECPLLKNLQVIAARKDVKGKKETSYTVSGNVNWCNQYGKQYIGSLKSQSYYMIQQPHSMACNQKIQNL